MTTEGLLEEGKQALSLGEWERARAASEEALAVRNSPEDWEVLSWASWWLEDATSLIKARERAYRLYREEGDPHGAARMALWLGNDHIDFLGQEAVAEGWFRRAARILDDKERSPEHGWLAAVQADAALQHDDTRSVRRLAAEAQVIGRRFDLIDLELTALAIEGLALVSEGHVQEGMRRLDESSAAALGGEYEGLVGVAWTCCYLIYACERVRDYDRAAQWCEKVGEFAQRMQIRFVNGVCRVHYGSVLTWHGSWEEAEAELTGATGELAEARPCWASEGVVRLADLRRRQGRFDEAHQLFSRVGWHPLARLGMAELYLDQGDLPATRHFVEKVLHGIPSENRTQRAAGLELAIRLEAATGEHEAAAAYLEELRSIGSAIPTAPLRAALSYSEGVVAIAQGDYRAGRYHFEEAAELFREGVAPFEEARARLELALALDGLKRTEAAIREVDAAHGTFRDLGATGEAERASTLGDRLEASRGDPPADRDGPLTPRQTEVLQLISEGLSDREIAETLVLSKHTIHRHISNIFTRLGSSSRAAAVARGYQLGLL